MISATSLLWTATMAQASETMGAGNGSGAGNTARDGDIAIREEFDAAKEKNTREAWALFMARHPEHPLTKRAQKCAAALEDRKPLK